MCSAVTAADHFPAPWLKLPRLSAGRWSLSSSGHATRLLLLLLFLLLFLILFIFLILLLLLLLLLLLFPFIFLLLLLFSSCFNLKVAFLNKKWDIPLKVVLLIIIHCRALGILNMNISFQHFHHLFIIITHRCEKHQTVTHSLVEKKKPFWHSLFGQTKTPDCHSLIGWTNTRLSLTQWLLTHSVTHSLVIHSLCHSLIGQTLNLSLTHWSDTHSVTYSLVRHSLCHSLIGQTKKTDCYSLIGHSLTLSLTHWSDKKFFNFQKTLWSLSFHLCSNLKYKYLLFSKYTQTKISVLEIV